MQNNQKEMCKRSEKKLNGKRYSSDTKSGTSVSQKRFGLASASPKEDN